MAKNTPLVSIIIVSYNTKELLLNCIKSVEKFADIPFELIISDNGSTDGSLEAIKKLKNKNIILVENKANLGFAKGNNVGKKIAQAKYVLFLNPDTLLHKNTLRETVKYMEGDNEIGAMTCKVVLPTGSLDLDTRRSFPTPFIALTHFSGLDRLFPKSKLLAKYWYGYISENTTHEIESLQGAYFLARRSVLDKVSWFDEDYFLDGEDIDLCWKIKKAGYKIIYYPEVSITHIKKGSKSKNRSLKSIVGGMNAMETFYRKRLWNKYPSFVSVFVILGIKLLKGVRIAKFYLP